jgi:hypothetical protein
LETETVVVVVVGETVVVVVGPGDAAAAATVVPAPLQEFTTVAATADAVEGAATITTPLTKVIV